MSVQSLPILWADESSSTGENLLDRTQRIYTTAGVLLPEDTAREVVERVRAAMPPSLGEPKFTTLVGSGVGRSALMSSLAAVPTESAALCGGQAVHGRCEAR